MKKFLYPLMIIVLLILIIAFFTKPSQETCYTKIQKQLTATGHPVGLFLSHDKKNPKEVYSTVTIKDMIFYRDIFYFENGEDKKVAVGAFTRIFLINP